MIPQGKRKVRKRWPWEAGLADGESVRWSHRTRRPRMVESIRQYFRGLPDPRCRRGRRHRLDELVIIAILAVICCTDNCQEVAQWAYATRKWLTTFPDLRHGVP